MFCIRNEKASSVCGNRYDIIEVTVRFKGKHLIRGNRYNIIEVAVGFKRKPDLNNLCIPENFNTNISHQLFDYSINFVNSQH